MKKVWVVAMVLVVSVGLLVLPLMAQQPAQTASNKAFKLGVGMNLNVDLLGNSAFALIGAGEYSLTNNWAIYADTGIAWQGVEDGFLMTFPVGGVLFYNYKLEAFGQDIQIGPGVGLTVVYNASQAGWGLTFTDYLISLQAKWEAKVDNLLVFIKGGPFVILPIENKDFGLLLEGGIWLW